MNLQMFLMMNRPYFVFVGLMKILFSYEDFIGLYKMKKANATNMVAVIKDIILRLGLDGEK